MSNSSLPISDLLRNSLSAAGEVAFAACLASRRAAECVVRRRFRVGTAGGPAALTREDLEDALQNTYASIWTRLTTIPGEDAVAEPTGFVVALALRSATALYRRNRTRAVRLLASGEGDEPAPLAAGARANIEAPPVEDTEGVGDFLTRVCGLGAKSSGVLALLLAGYPDAQVAERLHLSAGAVAKLKWRAVCQVRARVQADPCCRERARLALE